MSLNEGADAFLQDGDAASLFGFQVDGDHRIVKRGAQKEPALHFFVVKGHADTLVVRAYDVETRICLAVGVKVREDFLPVGLEILRGDAVPDFGRLSGLAELFDQGLDLLSFLLELRHAADDLGGDVGAVIGEIILLERAVAGGLDGELTDFAGGIQLDALVDDVLVASLETEDLP